MDSNEHSKNHDATANLATINTFAAVLKHSPRSCYSDRGTKRLLLTNILNIDVSPRLPVNFIRNGGARRLHVSVVISCNFQSETTRMDIVCGQNKLPNNLFALRWSVSPREEYGFHSEWVRVSSALKQFIVVDSSLYKYSWNGCLLNGRVAS